MPYTPPSHRSPSSSAPSSPNASRRSSIVQMPAGVDASASRPALPRSASYIARHRRTPSFQQPSQGPATATTAVTQEITPPGTSDDLKGMLVAHTSPIRQSPAPVADARTMPPGALISPPESSSEDEGHTEVELRGRQIENLKELQDAISAIPQHREGSPTRALPGDLLVLPSQARELIHGSKNGPTTVLPSLDTNPRRISHTRSITEPHIVIAKPDESAVSLSEDNSEQDEPLQKPAMVRKKSGELVRPALRPASLRRPSSMPGTPTYSKAVHFDSHLEHVRHFLQVDRPLAVSAGSSPNDNYESDTEYPFRDASSTRTPPSEWELLVNNFPAETPIRKVMPVRLERVWMSPDQKSLLGSIIVANLAFQKTVHCRFTFDYWKTTSEVAAEYSHEIRPRETESGYDRFQFAIKLSDMANLESKTLYFCVRYIVNGQEHWDNNNNVNFQVDFRKKALPQNGKRNFQGASARPANSLPRSNRRSNASAAPRPKSMPVGALDDFDSQVNYDQPIHEFLGESQPLRLKTSKSASTLPSDNLSGRLSTPSGQAFGHRYDFGASLTAAIKSHKDTRNDGHLYMKSHKKTASFEVKAPTAPVVKDFVEPKPLVSTAPLVASPVTMVSGSDSPAAASIASSSYEEILNKYCFFNGSKQASPQILDGTLKGGRFDGADDALTHSTNSTVSSSNGSPDMSGAVHRGAVHHTLRHNLNPYFQNAHMVAIGASPADSPFNSPSMSPASSTTPKAGLPGAVTSYPAEMNGTAPPFQNPTINVRFPFTADAHSSPAIRG
ncbi:putative phosphatase regulatory subunit-domain-containing protein [Microdochium trichocladiopsis]|uniref:Phosphatase regulatory subunit-domain-containing protein n=1 Tax=Microdochium trichocladiopsis TaxID=1682393 RepID=A0A9P8YCN8_9PEZI|nr:putative phosphatase regulatory subunit-domain-containing protein [Microdochium trichocladiopsis]KAH7038326.1 putative phosphatase regulatory subunit-domain-containing protein [Microdochium trichocladiopsis]